MLEAFGGIFLATLLPCFILLAGYGAGIWPVTKRWLHPVWLGSIAFLGIAVIAFVGPLLVNAVFGRCDTGAGRIATNARIYGSLVLAAVVLFAVGGMAARWRARSLSLSLAALAGFGGASIGLLYIAYFIIAFPAAQCLL